MKIINAQLAKTYNSKNTKLKLLKTNAAIWFNKICKVKDLNPNYISIRINVKTTRDEKTAQKAVKYRIGQEIKFLYKKKQQLNRQLYQLQLEGAAQQNGMWQHALVQIDELLNRTVEGRYQTLNKKLDTFINKPRTPRAPAKQPQTQPRTQPRIINLTNT